MPPDADRRPVAPVRDLLAGLAWGAAWWAAAAVTTGRLHELAGILIYSLLGGMRWGREVMWASFAAGPLLLAAPAAWATFRRPGRCRRGLTWAVRWGEVWLILGSTAVSVLWLDEARPREWADTARIFAPPLLSGAAAAGLCGWGRHAWGRRRDA